ncbi:MAG: CDP-diacylglycerol--glycerol-3-phosphate 3-phosphatidyltransferase [Caulobacterales bacterium 68-7]|nr:CDP-alcohol phosphatidyltransferase family protein [Caulobacterales bacterium]OJU08277.1 MAG: CDP-diacylglycerol--glycerol-3-phosphate 3-phosphatidyltransferase [Caulobacterales bacterium 68-7]
MTDTPENRRPLKSRNTALARRVAAALARAGVSPDAVSAGSILFGLAGAGAFVAAGVCDGPCRALALIAGAVCVQLRLACNLMDGMVAVEHGRGGPHGPLWNEIPDRIADVLFLIGAGYGAMLAGVGWADDAGWMAAALAILTAYVREIGRALGQPADFAGPMAKPHRMALLTGAAVVACFEPLWGGDGQVMAFACAIIAVGAAFTALRRTLHIAARLSGA